MAFQVASLFAKIGADTTDLNRGLKEADAKLDATANKMRGAGTAAGEAEGNTKKLGLTLGQLGVYAGLATAGIAAVGVAVKKVFDFAEAGAGVIQMRASFAGLGIDMDTLQAKAGGTIDEMTLMAATAKLLAGTTGELSAAMAVAAPQLIEIARAAVKLDPTIGSVAFVYESLAKGIKKNQPLLIDNANLIVSVGEANKRMAESMGVSVGQLNEEQKSMALLEDTLRAGDVMLQQVGGSADAVGDSFSRLRASIKNNTDELKANAAEGLLPVVSAMADYLEQAKLIEEFRSGQKPAGPGRWVAAIEEAESAQRSWGATADRYAGLADYYASQQDKITDSAIQLSTVTYGSAGAYDVVAEAIKRAQGAVGNYSTEFYESIRAVRLQAEAELVLGAVNSDLTKSFRETSDEMAGLRGERADLIAQLGELQGKADGAGGAFGDMVENGKKISEIEGAIAGVTGKMDELIGKTGDSIRSFILQQMAAQLALDDWEDSEIAFFEDTAKRFGMYDELWVQTTLAIVTTAKAVEDGTMSAEEAGDAMMKTWRDLAGEAGVLREVMPVAFDETANSAGRATGAIDSLVGVNSDAEGSFIDLRDTAVPAVDEVAMAAGLVGSALMGAVTDAGLLKAALDLLAEADITINVKFNVDELRLPSVREQEINIGRPERIMFAEGGTVPMGGFGIVGEAGPELVQPLTGGTRITPLSGNIGAMGGRMGGGASRIDINVYGTNDPEATANLVFRKLVDRGMISQGGMR